MAVARRPGLLSVAEASARLGVSPRTLRYYEELGFLAPARTAGGHRLFGTEEIGVVERIGRMQALEFSLATIRKVLRYRTYEDARGERHLALDDLRAVVDEARADVRAVRDRIASLRRELEEATREAESLDRDVAFLETRLRERERQEADGGTR